MQKKFQALAKKAQQSGIDARSVEVNGHLFAVHNQLVKVCSKRLEEFDLLEGRFVAMLLIGAAGQMAPHELATDAGLTRASITAIIDHLEDRGYVLRMPSPSDRRSIFVKLTDLGTDVLDDVTRSQLEWLESTCQHFSEEEKMLIIKLLQKFSF